MPGRVTIIRGMDRTRYSLSLTNRCYGLLALLGLAVFLLSLLVVHMAGNGFDWQRHYVSSLANEPLGWVFISGAFVHGWGNLALALGLHGALRPGRLRNWGVVLFGLAAVGILLAALFPIDAPGEPLSASGLIHRSAASLTFALELAALFVFSTIFRYQRHWLRLRTFSFALSVCAAVALTGFVIALQLQVAPGLAERVALTVFLVWEIWIAMALVRLG